MRAPLYPPFLKNHRNYPFHADRVLMPVADQLAALAAWALSIADELSLADWRAAAVALQRAAELIRAQARGE